MRQRSLSSVPAPDEWEIVYRPYITETEEEISHLYHQGLSTTEIGRNVGLPANRVQEVISRLLKRSFIERRG